MARPRSCAGSRPRGWWCSGTRRARAWSTTSTTRTGRERIAGMRNAAGNVVGLMPHPEHAVDPDLGPTGGQPLFASLLARGAREVQRDRAVAEEPLHRAARADGRRVRADRGDARPRAEPRRAGDVRRHVVRALLLQVAPSSPAHAADRGPVGAGRPRPGRRRRRPRRRHRRRVQDGVALAPQRDRAVPGRGHGRRRDRARHPLDGGPAGGADRPAAVRAAHDERNRWLLAGVVAGIGGYGNCIGVPTVGGEIHFAAAHGQPDGERDVRGASPADGLLSSASREAHAGRPGALRGGHRSRRYRRRVGPGLPDARRGRGGSRPSVQIGDPFAEKLLIEASLELIDAGLLVGLQDLGGAGITCAVTESAARAGMGADLDLDAVPLREPGMEPFEILTSSRRSGCWPSSHPSNARRGPSGVREVGARAAVIADARDGRRAHGRTGGGRGRGAGRDRSPTRVPVRPPDAAAGRSRPRGRPGDLAVRGRLRDAFLAVLGSPNVASKRWAYEQYDALVQGRPWSGRERRGRDPAPRTLKAMALASDGNGRYGPLDPYLGAAHAVAEAARNVAATGARPLAITNCLNFGNPERPEVMWEFAEAIRGLGDACRGVGDPGHRRERLLLQRVGRLGDLADAGDRDARAAGRLPAPRAHRLPAWGLAIYLLGETFAELGGRSSPRRCWAWSGGARRRSTSRRGRCSRCCTRRPRRPAGVGHDCADGGSPSRWPSTPEGGRGFTVTVPDAWRRTCRCS